MYTELKEYAAANDLDRFEDRWMEALGAGDLESSAMEALLDAAEVALDRQDSTHRLATLLELLCACIAEDTTARVTLRLFWHLLRFFPENRSYLNIFCEAYVQVYPVASPERAFFDAASVAQSSDVAGSLARLDSLLRYREGAFVFHRSGWGVGRVLSVDPFLKQVRVDLEEKKDHRIAIDVVDSILDFLEPDSFQALLLSNVEGLHRLRDEDPVGLVTKVLDAFGNPLGVKDIKSHLVPAIVPTKDWTKWWNKTKALLRDSGYFRVGDRAPHRVEKLESAISYADELIRDYYASSWLEARKVAKQAARKSGGEYKDAWEKIRPHLLELKEGDDVSVAIDAATIYERGEIGGSGVLAEVLARFGVEKLADAIQGLPGPEAQRRAANALVDARPEDWQNVARALVLGRSDVLRNVALGLLEERAPEAALEVVGSVAANPPAAFEAFCWLLNVHVAGSDRPGLEPFRQRTSRELVRMLLDLCDHQEHRASRVERTVVKEAFGRIQQCLGAKDGDFFAEGIRGFKKSELVALYSRIVNYDDILPDLKAELLGRISEQAPELEQEEPAMPWEENCIYTTSAGLEKRREQFREIMETKLPKNFEEIGRAASFGDLSENAEYTAALETRDQLTRQAKQIEEELEIAKIIEPASVNAESIALGTRVSASEVESGENKIYTILGPWDGSPEEGVLNYHSPLARALFGRRAGEQVDIELPGGSLSLKIERISSHFDEE